MQLKRSATAKDGASDQNQETSEGRESKVESASPDLKVKSFEEIMEEKKARRLGRFGTKNQDSTGRRASGKLQRLGEKINTDEAKKEIEQCKKNFRKPLSQSFVIRLQFFR